MRHRSDDLARRTFPALSILIVLVSACGPDATAPAPALETVIAESTVLNSRDATRSWQAVGRSVQGRPIKTLTLGHGPRKVLFVGGIHGDEQEGAYTTSQLPEAFISQGLVGEVTLTILEDANPDGRSAKTRFNANGVDVNRNFPATNFDTANLDYGGSPLTQPESRVVHDLIKQIDPGLLIVMHSWNGRQFINFDGPARQLAERFSAETGLPVADSRSFPPTPGSLGSYVGRDLGTPVLTIELQKGSDPLAGWELIRSALLEVIEG